jgi:hypothetical protein
MKSSRLAYIIAIICWLAYAVLSLFAPQTSMNNNLSGVQSIALRLTILVPVGIIWLIALRGALAFKNYTQLIKNSPEASGVGRVADGLLWTVAYLILIALIGSLLPYVIKSPAHDIVAILRDHIPAWTGLIAFTLLYLGSHQLRPVANFTTWTLATHWGMLIYAIFSGLFVLAFFSSDATTVSDANRTSAMILPHGVVLFSLILPYLVGWFLGLLASINITKYSHKVKGILYRGALRDLARGISAVITFAIILQLTTLSSRFLINLRLSFLILIVYIIIVLYGLGFVFIDYGAKKLTKIEVVE